MTVLVALLAALAVSFGSPSSAFAREWLSVGSKGMSPTVTSKSGIGTANASAEAKVTRQDAVDWCENWLPDDKGCVANQLEGTQNEIYRASADCTRGRITPIDGQTYTLAGVWDNSDIIAAGKTRWKNAAGEVIGRDNASGGLDISQQWEVLCPGPLKVRQGGAQPPRAQPPPASAKAAPPAAAKTAPPAGAPAKVSGGGWFAVGETIEAKYGREWVRGRIAEIQPGPQYDVRLENGKRGIVPPDMIRKPQQ